MKLENQVCSLEQAKRLRDLGVTQGSSQFIHFGSSVGDVLIIRLGETVLNNEWDAFTVAELGVMLPNNYTSYKLADIHAVGDGMKFWIVETDFTNECELCEQSTTVNHSFTASPSEAQSRASILIQLLETGQITAEEVNQRLAAA